MTFTCRKWKGYRHANGTITQWKLLTRIYSQKTESGDLGSLVLTPNGTENFVVLKVIFKNSGSEFHIKLQSRTNNFINQEYIRKRNGRFFSKLLHPGTILPELKRKLWTNLMSTKLSFPASTLHISAKTGKRRAFYWWLLFTHVWE